MLLPSMDCWGASSFVLRPTGWTKLDVQTPPAISRAEPMTVLCPPSFGSSPPGEQAETLGIIGNSWKEPSP